MSRRPDTPCSGCGTLLWGGSGSLPSGARRCRACRRQDPPKPPPSRSATCIGCRAPFTSMRTVRSGRDWRTTCSRKCAQSVMLAGRLKIEKRECADCGGSTFRSPNHVGSLCDGCLVKRRRARNRRKNAARQGAAIVGPVMSIDQLGDRDRWVCHLCRRRVGRSFRAPHPRSATFDHLIPIADGGTDAPENLRLAHFGCNSRRGSRGTVQLLLFG